MDDKIYNLVIKILDSELSKGTKDEIVRFFLLPRNTPIRPMIESDIVEDVGSVNRPDSDKIRLINNPKLKEEDEDTRRLLGEK